MSAKETLKGARPNAGYIEPLDGLRAVAILTVLFFHLDEAYLPGGFVGVDVFFTISGYIITRNILLSTQAGRFRLGEFYKRRVSRLLPAVLATVCASIIAASFVYSEAVLSEYARAGIYSIVSVANIHFWLHSGYFDDASKTNIFLHMWSLSVEEQFYLVWPILIALVARAVKYVAPILTGLLVVSLMSAWVLAETAPSAAFYLMPARIFQFAIGALVAVWHVNQLDLPLLPQRARVVAANAGFLLGITLIGVSAALADGMHYRFFVAAVLPVVGTTLVIACIRAPLCTASLGFRPARFIGTRAYALYLVHWPLFVMASVLAGGRKPVYVNAALVAACFVLAEILHRGVEQPFRLRERVEQRVANNRRVAAIVISLVASLVVLAHVWVGPERLARADNSTASVDRGTLPVPARAAKAPAGDASHVSRARGLWAERSRLGRADRGCQLQVDQPFATFDEKSCVWGSGEGGRILILGDSYSAETLILLSQVIPAKRLAIAGGAGCLPVYPEPNKPATPPGCRELNVRRFEWALRDEIDALVLTSNWRNWSSESLRSTLAFLASTGKPVLLVGVRPVFLQPVPVLLDSAVGKAVATDLNRYLAFDIASASAMLTSASKEFGEQVVALDVMRFLCPGKCAAFTPDGALIYLDMAHISADAAIHIGKQINAETGEALRRHFTRRFQASGPTARGSVTAGRSPLIHALHSRGL